MNAEQRARTMRSEREPERVFRRATTKRRRVRWIGDGKGGNHLHLLRAASSDERSVLCASNKEARAAAESSDTLFGNCTSGFCSCVPTTEKHAKNYELLLNRRKSAVKHNLFKVELVDSSTVQSAQV